MRLSGPSISPRLGWALVLVLAVVVLALAAQRVFLLGSESRDLALTRAGQTIQNRVAELIEPSSPAATARLRRSVAALVDEGAAGLNFLTIADRRGAALASSGNLEHRLDWLPSDSARSLRALLYRLGSSERVVTLERGGDRVGRAHYGVGWFDVVMGADSMLPAWLMVALAALLFACYAGGRLRSERPAKSPARATTQPATVPESEPHRHRARGRRRARGERSNDFAPIGEPPADARRSPQVAAEPAADAPPAASAAEGPVARPDERAASPAPVSSAAPAATSRAAVEFHAPRVEVGPHLGDDTLDLRFYPVWRDPDARILAGAWAALAWRSDSALVDAETLTQLAEREGALRAFTQWIARRFSLLNGNWRTLELPTVPIILPIPNAMFAFADAEAVWRHALRRTDRDPNDLILKLGMGLATPPHASLPVRRAVPFDQPGAELPADCDVVHIRCDRTHQGEDEWLPWVSSLDCPVLLGPIDDVEPWAALIAQQHVHWYSLSDDRLCSTRSFGRLLVRYSVAPL